MYELGQKVVSKKPHACGGKEWKITRIGADYKLECTTCGRIIMVDKSKLDKMSVVKNYFLEQNYTNGI